MKLDTVTVDAVHPFLRHNITQTLSLRTGMATVATGPKVIRVLFVHGFGEIRNFSHTRLAQCIRSVALGAQNRAAIHQRSGVAEGILIHILHVMEGQNIGLHAPRGDPFQRTVIVAVLTMHLG